MAFQELEAQIRALQKRFGGILDLSAALSGLGDDVAAMQSQLTTLESWKSSTEAWTGANRPAFQAKGATTVSKSGTQSYSIFVFGTELLDRRGNYSTSTGRFTAPVAGLYQFNFALTATTANGGPEARLFINGSDPHGNLAIGYTTAYMTFGTSAVVNLAVGDLVDVRWQNNNNVSASIDGTRSSFSGYYIG